MIDMTGHNLPGNLAELLSATYDELLLRKVELVEAANRAPKTCDDDETAKKLTDFVGQMAVCIKRAEDARKVEKEPYWQAGLNIDGFFRDIRAPLLTFKQMFEGIIGDYQHRKQEAAKAAAQAEAERLAALAETDEDLQAAIDQETIADARPLERSRIHGDLATASLVPKYDFVLDNLALVPRKFLMLDESMVRAHIDARPQDGAPEPVPGLRFIPRYIARIRA